MGVEKNIAKKSGKELSKKAGSGATEEVAKRFSKEWMHKYGGWGAMNAVASVMDYNNARAEGKGLVGSVTSAAGWFVAGEMLGPKMLPIMLGAQLPSLAVSSLEGLDQMTRNMAMTNMYKNTPFFNARFQDTQSAYTMRQAGMQQAKNSQYRLEQSMMGNEAQYMKRS